MSPKVDTEQKKVFDEIDGIEVQKLASDLPEEFIGTVVGVVRDVKKGDFGGAPILRLTILTEDGDETVTTYRIPKAWTGRGQMDALKTNLEKIGLSIRDLPDGKFRWKRIPLTGAMKGNARHYPVEVIVE